MRCRCGSSRASMRGWGKEYRVLSWRGKCGVVLAGGLLLRAQGEEGDGVFFAGLLRGGSKCWEFALTKEREKEDEMVVGVVDKRVVVSG